MQGFSAWRRKAVKRHQVFGDEQHGVRGTPAVAVPATASLVGFSLTAKAHAAIGTHALPELLFMLCILESWIRCMYPPLQPLRVPRSRALLLFVYLNALKFVTYQMRLVECNQAHE